MFRFLPLTALIFVTACQSEAIKPAKPDWINDPGQGAVGSSVTHVKGRHYQEELAIARARERLAARYGVEISSVQSIQEKVANDKAYVTSVKQIEQAVKSQTVKAQVRETWYDAAHDEIWVWVHPIN
jgi:alkylation response protein AidB-like acyl-CoA dehydrogenase